MSFPRIPNPQCYHHNQEATHPINDDDDIRIKQTYLIFNICVNKNK